MTDLEVEGQAATAHEAAHAEGDVLAACLHEGVNGVRLRHHNVEAVARHTTCTHKNNSVTTLSRLLFYCLIVKTSHLFPLYF